MCQRHFVPDWVTCALIQPLGLMEDVVVVLAAWAGESPASAKMAEMALYIFMATMNGVNWWTSPTCRQTSSPHEDLRAQNEKWQHLIVLAVTIAAGTICASQPVASPLATTTPAALPAPCAPPHANLGVMVHLTIKVSVIAIFARLLARLMVSCRRSPRENATTYALLS